MKGILLIHPCTYSNGDVIVNFDVLIEKTWINRLLFKRICKIIDSKLFYEAGCLVVCDFLQKSKKKYWYLASDDLNHVSPEYNNNVINDLLSLKLETVVIYK